MEPIQNWEAMRALKWKVESTNLANRDNMMLDKKCGRRSVHKNGKMNQQIGKKRMLNNWQLNLKELKYISPEAYNTIKALVFGPVCDFLLTSWTSSSDLSLSLLISIEKFSFSQNSHFVSPHI